LISRVFIANRGEIAVRIVRACRDLGIESVVGYSVADRESLAVRMADRAVCIGPASSRESYLRVDLVVGAALGTGCDALHPGYGFLAESAELAAACASEGLAFVGPTAEQIREMGNKLRARALASDYGLPLLPGSERVGSHEQASQLARRIGLPVIMKAAAGGGGRGMRIVNSFDDIQASFIAAASEARAAFGDDSVYIERYVHSARHVEVQVLGDGKGNVIHLGERDCSMQRRHQKLVEETPAPGLSGTLRRQIRDAAVTFAAKMKYANAGTIEFVVDQESQAFYFLEMNTRIQVEHPVSELVTGIDIVQEQLRIASGEGLRFAQGDIVFRGHAIECRINAELPGEGFRPDPGRITEWRPPDGLHLRLDSHCYAGYTVPPHYDSLIGKFMAYGSDRDECLARLQKGLERFAIAGIGTTVPFLRFLLAHPEFVSGKGNTRTVEAILPAFAGKARAAA
jgi:acetyl-CoA carboxylase biotin carboxylase subunit